jgi:general secretion pathway protein G
MKNKIKKRISENLNKVFSSTREAGFTLIEMMIVLAIIALIMGFVGTSVIRRFDESRVSATKIQMKQLATILDDFRRVCGFYPTSEQGLDALVKAPAGRTCKNYDPEGFVKKVPQDAWNFDFFYESDGNKFKITSYGADNKPGGDGFNKDITSDDD